MFEITLTIIFICTAVVSLVSLQKYKKLSNKLKETQIDVDNCTYKISVINEQLDFFQETIKKIEQQITELEAKAQPKRKTKKAE